MTSAMVKRQSVMPRYYAKAYQYLYEIERLELAIQDEIDCLAERMRYQDYRRHIEPYLKQKERIIGDFFSLQTNPSAQIPLKLKEALALWDEMIESEAQNFGYESQELAQ